MVIAMLEHDEDDDYERIYDLFNKKKKEVPLPKQPKKGKVKSNVIKFDDYLRLKEKMFNKKHSLPPNKYLCYETKIVQTPAYIKYTPSLLLPDNAPDFKTVDYECTQEDREFIDKNLKISLDNFEHLIDIFEKCTEFDDELKSLKDCKEAIKKHTWILDLSNGK